MIIILSTLFIVLIIVLIKFKLLAALFYLMPFLIKIREKFNLKTYQNKSSSDISNLHEAYEILGIDKSASIEEIETAYKDLIRKNHPDNGGSEYLAKKINLAKLLSSYKNIYKFNAGSTRENMKNKLAEDSNSGKNYVEGMTFWNSGLLLARFG